MQEDSGSTGAEVSWTKEKALRTVLSWQAELCGQSRSNFERARLALHPHLKLCAGVVLRDLWQLFAFNRQGTFFLQDCIAHATDEDRTECLHGMLPDLWHLIADKSGNYALQKLVDHAPEAAVDEIALELSPHVMELASEEIKLRTLQRVLHKASLPALTGIKRTLLDEAPDNATHQYYTKVLTSFVEAMARHEPSQMELLDVLRKQLPALMMHIYGSWICQAFFKFGSETVQRAVFKRVAPSTETTRDLAFDKYGSFVMETMLERCPQDLQEVMVARLEPRLEALRKKTGKEELAKAVDKRLARRRGARR